MLFMSESWLLEGVREELPPPLGRLGCELGAGEGVAMVGRPTLPKTGVAEGVPALELADGAWLWRAPDDGAGVIGSEC